MSVPPDVAEKVFEEWFSEVSKDLPPDIAKTARPLVRNLIVALLSGDKTVEKVMKQLDLELVERIIKSGNKPSDALSKTILLVEKLASVADPVTFKETVIDLVRFQSKVLKVVSEIYEKSIKDELEARRRVERAFRVLARVNETVLMAEDEKEILEKVCETIVDEGYAHAWIGYANKDGSVSPVAGYGSNYFREVEVRWDDSPLGQGPTGRAIRDRKIVIKGNLRSDFMWKDEATKRGFGSSIALPLIYKDSTFGSLNVYAIEEDAFDEEEKELLERIAAIISYGIALKRLKKEKERLIEQLDKNIEQFAILVDHIRNPLAAAHGFVESFVEDRNATEKIAEQLSRITRLVERLEKGWVESEKIREYLRKRGP
ncbi:GAF domain-containing protein [Archaeoglobus neptunius]|uniref:GAF domain-containing protein n=1 Tax=Archaeoglobus neptunius TaxID=2798580 RepID=UPI0019258885|nr:GAF domain-containing protein [Archaeoglobus neptunius]